MNIKSLKQEIEKLTNTEIGYKDYSKDEKMQWVGEMVEKNLKNIQKNYKIEELNLTRYSPFQYQDLEDITLGFSKKNGKRLPTWQVWMWERFLNSDGVLDFNAFKNSILFINKPKKVGNTYTIAHLTAALLLTDQIENAIAGAANMQWLTNFFMPAMRRIFPDLLPTTGRKYNKNRVISYSGQEKTFFVRANELKVIGMDSQKRRMKGHKAKFAFLDETASIKNYDLIYETLLNPILRTRGGIILGGTPDPDSGRWFNEIFEAAINKKGVYSGLNVHALKFNIYESGMWNEERIDEMLMLEYNASKSLYPNSEDSYLIAQLAQENFNYFLPEIGIAPQAYNFVRNEDAVVFPNEALPDISEFKIYVSIDYGESVADAMAATFYAYDGDAIYYLFAEWEQYDATIQATADNVLGILARYNINPADVTFYIDRTSHGKKFKSNDGYTEKLKDRFQQVGIYAFPASNEPKELRIDLTNKMFDIQPGIWHPFLKTYGCPQILIANNCVKLLHELKTLYLDWSERKKTIQTQFRTQKRNHLSDSVFQIIPLLNHIERPTPSSIESKKYIILKAKSRMGFKII